MASTVAAKSDFEPDVGRYLRQSGAIKGEMDGWPASRVIRSRATPPIQMQADRRGQHQPLGAAPRRDAAVNWSEQRHDQTYSRRGA